jgi:ribose-phosphate pyrophosphokinase
LTAAGADRVLTLDLHAQQIQGFFDIPVDHLYASPVIVKHLRKSINPDNFIVVAPDTGSVKMAQAYSDMIGCGFAIVAKRRISATEVESSHLVGDVEGKDCMIVDDMTATAGTLIGAAEQLKAHGANDIYAAVSHCCLNDKGKSRLLASDIKMLITTDSIPVKDKLDGRIEVLTISELLAKAIDRIHSRRSVSTLFRLSPEEDL